MKGIAMAWNRQFFLLGSFLSFAVLAPAPDAAAATQAAKAASHLRKEAKKQLKQLKDIDALVSKELELSLDLLLVRIQQGTIAPGDAAEDATEALLDAMTSLQLHATAVQTLVEVEATELLDDLNQTPADFRVGGAGAWDDFEERLHDEIAKVETHVARELEKFALGLQKLAPDRVVVLRKVGRAAIDPPAPGAAPETAVQRPVKVFAVAGSSLADVDNDGRLCVAGTADPAVAGGLVHVVVRTANGPPIEQDVVVAPDGIFRAFFPAAGDPNLPEGNYRIGSDQGGAPALAAVNAP
jgi:hypothetical protein